MKLITNRLVPKRLLRTNAPLLRKSFIMVLLFASLPTAMLAIITYFVGTAQIEREVDRTHQLRLQHMAETLNGQLEQLEKMVTMWTFNPIFQTPLGAMSPESLQKDPVLELNLAKTLLVMGGSSPLIKEVRLVVPDSSMYLSALNQSVVVPITNPEELEFFRSLLIRDTERYWTYAQGQLSIVQMVPERSPYGYLLVQVNPAAINDLMRLDPELQGSAFILKANGDWLEPATGSQDGDRAFDYFLRDEIGHRPDQQQGSFFSLWNGDKYAVTYGIIERTGWTYVSATPVTRLTQPVVTASRILLAVGGIGILASILLAWFASRKVTQPLDRVVQLFRSTKSGQLDTGTGDEVDFIERQWQFVNRESQLLHERMEQQIGTLRELFLFQLLNEHLSHMSEQELRSRMDQYGWDVEGKALALVVFRLIGYNKIRDRFGDGEEQLATFAAANVIGELAESQFEQAEVSSGSGQDLSISLFVLLPAERHTEEMRQQLYEFSEQAIRGLTTVLHLHVLVGIAKPVERIGELPLAYQEVFRSFRHRNVQEMSQIFVMEQTTPKDTAIVYPFEAEKELLRSLRAGDREGTFVSVEQFVHALADSGETEIAVRQGMNQLLGTFIHQILLTGYNPLTLYDGEDLYEELSSIREPEEMLVWFKRKIGTYLDRIEQSENTSQYDLMSETVEKVVSLLEEDYPKDISLEMYADRFDVGMSRLSASFKEVTGVNFIDYLTRLRLDKSKELLLHSSEKVNDIAFLVGYQPSYYYRVFKKHEGVTPTRYRELYK